jgi:expansin (peptidoglycan-binding protein)
MPGILVQAIDARLGIMPEEFAAEHLNERRIPREGIAARMHPDKRFARLNPLDERVFVGQGQVPRRVGEDNSVVLLQRVYAHFFGQGTARDGSGFRTACGYYGTENNQTDTIENIASMSPASATYFAAIPGQGGFDSKSHCGECVQITGQNGTMITATIIDECPYGNDGGNSACAANAGGHLDLSKSAFDRLGYPTGNPSGTNWKYVPCPVSGNVKVRFKSGNNNEFFVENVITPIASVSVNGQAASRQSYGAWHVGSAISTPATLNLTDMAGRSLTVMLNSGTSNQDTGRQFPACQ